MATPPAVEAITNPASAGTGVPEELGRGKGSPRVAMVTCLPIREVPIDQVSLYENCEVFPPKREGGAGTAAGARAGAGV